MPAGEDEQEYLVIAMADVLVTSVSTGGSEGDTAMKAVALAFAKVDLEAMPQNADRSLDAGVHFTYDLRANRKGYRRRVVLGIAYAPLRPCRSCSVAIAFAASAYRSDRNASGSWSY